MYSVGPGWLCWLAGKLKTAPTIYIDPSPRWSKSSQDIFHTCACVSSPFKVHLSVARLVKKFIALGLLLTMVAAIAHLEIKPVRLDF